MFFYVDAFPDYMLAQVPTLDRESDVSAKPDRWAVARSKHAMVTIPYDGLPRHEARAPTTNA